MIFYNYVQRVSPEGVAALVERYGVEPDGLGREPEENTLPRWAVREPPFGYGQVDVHDVIRWLGIAPQSDLRWRWMGGQIVPEPAASDIGPDGVCRCGCGWAP